VVVANASCSERFCGSSERLIEPPCHVRSVRQTRSFDGAMPRGAGHYNSAPSAL
jgi:hypothetical protein